jgi:hypothetical protein
MFKLPALFLLFFISCLTANAQNPIVTGTVKDTIQHKGVQNAVIVLLTPGDSVLYKFTRSDANGNFKFNNIKPGNYIVMTTHPYFADVLDNIEIGNADITLPPISLTSKTKLLQEVIIKSGNPIHIKGDTTIYTADSFAVSANANVEELLKKLPGIQVDKNGKITAMGEQVTKILVDGEEFFGDDPGMAVKNLRADAVKEVQVFDKKSDQSEFTGIDDGKTQKTINLKLKEDKKRGYFGKIDLSGGLLKGIDDRYNNNIMLSSFKGKRKITGFLLTGNTGQDGLNWEDSEKYGNENENMNVSVDDGGINFNWTGGSSDDEPYVDTDNGFIRNINAGVQYSNKWRDKYTLNLSPKYNSQIYTNGVKRFSQTQIGDSLLNENATVNTNVNRYNFKTSGSFDAKLDSNNSLKLTVKANFYHTQSEEDRESTSTGNTGTLKNTSNKLLSTNSDKRSLTAGLIFKHKFKKPRRTISINTDWNLLTTTGTNYLKSNNQAYFDGLPSTAQIIDQLKDNDKSAQKFSTRISYTEPLSKKYSLELAYEISYNTGKNDQVTYTYSAASGKYDMQVDSLTNNFTQSVIVNKPSFKISYNDKKIKFNFGSGFGLTHFDLQDITLAKDYIRNYTNFFPSASITYTYKSQRSIRINYDGSTSQPSINQLQPLRNNNDYFNQYIGNPNLKPSFTNSLNISHNSYNFLKDIFTYLGMNIRLTSNSITNNRVINVDSGKTVTQPINTNGNMSMNFYGGIGTKIKKINTRFQIGPSVNFSKMAEVINNKTNHTNNFSSGIYVDISKSKEKKYDINIRESISYNSTTNSQSTSATHYFTNSAGMDATVYYKKTWSLNMEYELVSRQKTTQFSTNLNNQLWNAKLQKTFRKDEFTIYLKVRDILNQNIGITRNAYSNTYTEERNDRLKRYWLLGFAWNFKNKAVAAKK